MAKKDEKELSNRAKRKKEKQEKENQKAKSWLREWIDALVFAFIAAAVLRAFLFGSYKIPTPSMEKNLMVNDYLIVSNITYGPRTPMSICIPFTDACIPGVNLPWFRIPGHRDVERNDIIVFNYPIEVKPISQKTNYIKRAVGIPGDTLSVVDKSVFINGVQEPEHIGLQEQYIVTMRNRARLTASKVNSAGAQIGSFIPGTGQVVVNATSDAISTVSRWSEVDSVEANVVGADRLAPGYRSSGFNFSKGFLNSDNMPAFVVPYEGQEIELTEDNWHLYQDIIQRYEKNTVTRNGDQFTINGEQTNTYTIKQDYYFAMGDNRDNSLDSRFWGFVPHDHLIGKAVIVWYSHEGPFWKPRFSRLFNLID